MKKEIEDLKGKVKQENLMESIGVHLFTFSGYYYEFVGNFELTRKNTLYQLVAYPNLQKGYEDFEE